MQIESHNFSIIATEVSYVKPLSIGSLYFLSGERYDFLLNTKGHKTRDYWIRFRQMYPCVNRLEGFAIIRYHKNKINETQSIEFNDRIPPTFDDEFPNGTVCHFMFFISLLSFILIYFSFSTLLIREVNISL